MSEYIGVIGDMDFLNSSHNRPSKTHISLKRESLLFDKIAIPEWCRVLDVFEKVPSESKQLFDYKELRWLLEQEIVFAPEPIIERARVSSKLKKRSEYKAFDKKQKELRKEMDELKRRADREKEFWMCVGYGKDSEEDYRLYREECKKIDKELGPVWDNERDCEKRKLAIALRECNLDAVPVLTGLTPIALNSQVGKTDLIQVIINELPVPDELTPWEHILEFRSDPDTRRKFLALRNWVSEIARMELKPNEVKDKFESLIDEYRNHMKLHKMKTALESLKTIVIAEAGFVAGGWLAGLGALPGLAGMIVSPLYTIKQRQIALLEEERKAPGKEVAYIVKAQDTF
jgi:hypothetical protein